MPEFNANILVTAMEMPPAEAIAFLEKKGFKITWSWREVLGDANNRVFQVAKAMKMEILKDIREMVEKAIKQGVPFEQFADELAPKLISRGWWGKKTTVAGETVQLGSMSRLMTIYRTNTQSAYNAGRWKGQFANRKRRPWLMLIEVLDGKTRTNHRNQSGSIQRVDSNFWRSPSSWYPPNGYNCRGRVRPLTDAQAKARGAPIRKSNAQPDPGFGGNPGISIFKPQKKDYPPEIWKLGEKLKQ